MVNTVSGFHFIKTLFTQCVVSFPGTPCKKANIYCVTITYTFIGTHCWNPGKWFRCNVAMTETPCKSWVWEEIFRAFFSHDRRMKKTFFSKFWGTFLVGQSGAKKRRLTKPQKNSTPWRTNKYFIYAICSRVLRAVSFLLLLVVVGFVIIKEMIFIFSVYFMPLTKLPKAFNAHVHHANITNAINKGEFLLQWTWLHPTLLNTSSHFGLSRILMKDKKPDITVRRQVKAATLGRILLHIISHNQTSHHSG